MSSLFCHGSLVAAGAAWLRPKPKAPSPVVMRFQIPLPPGTSWPTNGTNSTQWTPSPDGRNLAMIAEDPSNGKTALWVRPLGATAARRLDKTEGATLPFWSPDGQVIAFFAEDKLKRVSLSGGSVQTVCRISGTEDGGAWGADGVIVFAAGASPLMRVNAMGGTPQPATALDKDEIRHSSPQILPDGRHVLYLAESKDTANNAIYIQELGSSKRVHILNNLTRAMWSPPGYLLFVREGTLFAQRMRPRTFQVEGEGQAVAPEVAANETNGRAAFAVSQNGVLTYRGGGAIIETAQLTWRDRNGKAIGTVGAPGKMLSPALSPDGKNVAVIMGDVEMDAWVLDLATGVPARMTHDATSPVYYLPVLWSPDSQRLVLTQARGGIERITLASGQIVSLSKERITALDWSADGRAILCRDLGQSSRLSLVFPENAAKPRIILETANAGNDRISPDGKYVAYNSSESGNNEIFIASFPSFAIKHKVSSEGGSFPVWAKGSRELFYRSNDGHIMNAEIHTGAAIESSIPKPLFKFAGGSGVSNRFDVSADGKRFLIAEPVRNIKPEKPEITLVLNWTAELTQP
jgi:eukaryotic-like serine/threonine-protein kinase